MHVKKTNLQKEVFRILTNSLDDWEFDKYHAVNTRIGISYWMGNGLLFFAPDGQIQYPLPLNWVYTIRLYRWLQHAKLAKIVQRVGMIQQNMKDGL